MDAVSLWCRRPRSDFRRGQGRAGGGRATREDGNAAAVQSEARGLRPGQWVLRFGSPIPCPSVTFKTPVGEPLFEQGFKLNMDWAAWLKKAREPGEFVWIREVLMHHRIHEMSETSKGIAQGYRAHEDMEILQRMWPRPIARAIAASYGIAYKSNSH